MKEPKTNYAVTRTVTVNKLNVMCVNIQTAEIENRIVILKELPKKESALMTSISIAINDDTIKPVQDSMYIANTVYHSTSDIESAIKELEERIENMGVTIIKCGYWFILAYLHYMNDDVILSILASECIKVSYKKAVSDNG